MALAPGSIAFVGINTAGGPDDWIAFAALEAITAGTVIYFTDNELATAGSATFNTGESYTKWTAPAAGVAAGQVVTITSFDVAGGPVTNVGAVSALAFPSSSNRGFSQTADSVYAYLAASDATADTPTAHLARINLGNATDGQIPASLGATQQISFTSGQEGALYTGPHTGLANFSDFLALINDPTNWTLVSGATLVGSLNTAAFSTNADIEAPTLADVTPADDATGVAIGSNITLEFSEDVQKGTGNILIKLASDGSVVQTIDVASAAVTVAGAQITVNPPTDLAANTAYYVEVEAGAIEDISGNDFAGLAGATTFNFSTGAANAIGGIVILDEAESLQGSVQTPEATHAIELVRLGTFAATGGNAEVVSFDPGSDQLFILNATGNKIEIVHISSTGALNKTGEINLATLTEFGSANSVAIKNGIVAVAYANSNASDNGHVALFDTAGNFVKTVEVGVLPDQVTFTPDGSKILVANEAEPVSAGNNPAGTVSIIDVSGGAAAAALANTISFASLNGSETALDDLGLAMFPGQTASADIEPEYISVAPDGTRAYVTLQEVNAVAVIDLTNPAADRPIAILPLGGVDRSLAGNEFDGSDQDGTGTAGKINIANWDVKSLLQPDAIATFTVGGETYFITANEGDARVVFTSEEVRLSSGGYVLDPTAYPNASALKNNDGIGRLNVINHEGNTDADPEFEQIVTYGGRGISIFKQNDDGTIVKVRETGGEFEKILSEIPGADGAPNGTFNSENIAGTFDGRSDNKGPEPEGVAVQEINGKLYAFVVLERTGGIMVYDVTNPAQASFVSYEPPTPFSAALLVPPENNPETVITISAADSPLGIPLVVVASEVGNSTSVYAAITPIYAIQGSGHVTSFAGQIVTTIGVVTAIDTNGSRGFYIQDVNGDGNAATSDGIFVFTNAAPTVTVGQLVRVSGTAGEFTPNGAAPGAFSTTQIDARAAASGVIAVLGDGEDVVAVQLGGPGGLLPSMTSFADASALYESLEGMLVNVVNPIAVGPTTDFGEIYAVLDNDNNPANGVNATGLTDRGTLLIEGGADDFGNTDVAGGDFNPERIQIDDDNGVLAGFVTPDVNAGAVLESVTGIMNYDFGNYQVVATEAYGVAQASTLTKETGTLTGSADRLLVASYNAENLDANDPAARFTTIASEIINRLNTPDIIALQEIQDNNGAVGGLGSTVTAANLTLQQLVDAISAAGGPTHAFLDNPFIGDDTNGGEPGGNIRTAFLYRADRVDFVDGSLRTVAANGAAITNPAGNIDQQTNPDNPFYSSRPPLIATFEFNGEEVTLVNNHFTSKGGSGALYGSDSTPLNAGEVQRAAQAQAVNNFVDSLLGNDANAKIIVLGDLNDFEFESPLDVIKGTASISNYDTPVSDPINATATFTPGGTAVLHDMLDTLPPNEQYDYFFEGNAQTLDHVLVSGGLQVGAQFDVVRINAEFADQTSDHDPLLASFEISPATFTLQLLHFADGEAGLLASSTASNLAALVDAFDDDYGNTLILAGGDNWLPGPFLAAGTDLSVTPILNAVSGSNIALNANIPIGAVDIAIHNEIGVEASAIGNHEFDLGSRVFRDSFTPNSVPGWVGANFVHVSANLDFSGDADLNPRFTNTLDGGTGTSIPEASTLKGRIAPSAVITKNGEKIGLVGATTQILEQISSPSGTEVKGFPTGPGPNGEVDNMALLAAQLQPVIDELRAEGVNKIILMAHLQQIINEKALASLLSGVDIILSAGSNTRLGDGDDVPVAFPGHSADFADTYPLQVQDADGKTTLIVNTDNEYTYLGRLVVEFDANGDIIPQSLVDNVSINGAYASTLENVAEAWGTTVDNLENTAFAEGTKGEEVRDLTDAVDAVIQVKDGNVYGYTDVYLEGERIFVRNQETNLGNITADANAYVAQQALGDLPFLVSLKNGGGIRAQIGTLSAPDPVDGSVDKLPPPANPDAGKEEGGVSQLDVENSLRFNNKLMVFETTPQGLLNILNWGAGLGANNGGFPQIGGVRFSFDPDLPGNAGSTPGSRVRDVALIDEDGNVVAMLVNDGLVLPGAPAVINVVALNFTANGGDGYPVKANGENFRFILDNGTLSAPVSEALDFVTTAPANGLGEQAAMAQFMLAEHGTQATAYNEADTSREFDTRIQNLNFRDDAVLENGINDAALVVDDSYAAVLGQNLHVDAKGVLANDVDVEGDALTALLVGGGLNGKLVLNANGSFDFMPYFAGPTSFTYKANDGNSDSAAATVTINVAAGADTFDFSGSMVASTKQATGGINNIYAGSGNDTLVGNNNGNILSGGVGNDVIVAGNGNDFIIGGAGNDRQSGRGGDDVFVFRSGFGKDTVTDFQVGDTVHHDTLDLRGLGFDTLEEVLAATSNGPNAVITVDDNNSITLLNVTKALLSTHTNDILI